MLEVPPIKLNNEWQIYFLNYIFQCIQQAKYERAADMVQFILCEGGLGSGKSYICAYIFILLLFIFPGNLGLAGAETYPVVKDLVIPQILELLPPETIAKYPQSHPQSILLKNGSQIWFRQLSKAGKVKGPQYGAIYVEEASNISKSVNDMLIARLRQPGIPLRCLLYATNPEEYSHVAKLFDRQKDNTNYRSYISTTKDNKDNLPSNYEENLRLSYDEILQLKYLDGVRVNTLGKEFPEFTKKAHGYGHDNVLGIVKAPEGFDYIITGCDVGFATPGCLAVIGIRDLTYWLLDIVYTAGKGETWWVDEGKRLHDKWGFSTLWVDAAEPGRIDQYVKAGLDARASIKDKGSVQNRRGMLRTLMHIRPDTGYPRYYYNYEECKIFAEEALALSKKKVPGTEHEYTEEVANNSHDHAIDAVTYAIYGDSKEHVDWSESEVIKPEESNRDMIDTYMAGGTPFGNNNPFGV